MAKSGRRTRWILLAEKYAMEFSCSGAMQKLDRRQLETLMVEVAERRQATLAAEDARDEAGESDLPPMYDDVDAAAQEQPFIEGGPIALSSGRRVFYAVEDFVAPTKLMQRTLHNAGRDWQDVALFKVWISGE